MSYPQEPEDSVNQQQRHGPRKQLTHNRNAHDIGSSLYENNYKEIVYMNKYGVLEELWSRISCLAPNSRANNIENIEDTFHLYFDNDIMNKIVDCTSARIN